MKDNKVFKSIKKGLSESLEYAKGNTTMLAVHCTAKGEENMNYKNLVGKTIRIISMKDEPSYNGREGIVRSVDDKNQLHGTWGGLAVIPQVDIFKVLN